MLAAAFVTGRGIHRHAALAIQSRAVIPHVRHGAVRHIVHLIVPAGIAGPGAEGEDIGPGSHIPVLMHVGRVHLPVTVHQEAVGIEFSREGGRCIRPHAAGPFLEVRHARCVIHHLLAVDIHLDGAAGEEVSGHLHHLCFGVVITESDGVVGIDLRGDDARSRAEGLLGRCCHGKRQQRSNKEKTFHKLLVLLNRSKLDNPD